MGQKTSPIGFRTGITLGWQSTWFAPKANYGDFLVEDWKVREYVDKRFNRQPPYSAVSKIEIARTRNEVKVTLHTARPGMVIGPRGAEVEALKEELEELINRKINVNVIELKEPSLDAKLVAEGIAEQLKKRASYRRAMKSQCENVMNAGAKGVKILCSGRLGGAEIARNETQKLGSIPLQTLDANVDYGTATSRTTYGAVGRKGQDAAVRVQEQEAGQMYQDPGSLHLHRRLNRHLQKPQLPRNRLKLKTRQRQNRVNPIFL